MDATHDDTIPTGDHTAHPAFWRRLVPATLFLAGAATVILVGFGGHGAGVDLQQSKPAALAIEAAGDGVMITARLESDSNMSLVAGDLAADDDDWSVILMEVTAYCPCQKCCGPRASGITASGKNVDHNSGKFVAADTRLLPFGTQIQVPGYGSDAGDVVEVIDRGGAIKGYRLDVFYPDHATARQWGRQVLPVRVYSPEGRRGD